MSFELQKPRNKLIRRIVLEYEIDLENQVAQKFWCVIWYKEDFEQGKSKDIHQPSIYLKGDKNQNENSS